MAGGQRADFNSSHSYYSVSPQSLYQSLSGYLTFVEGDDYEAKKQKEELGNLHGGGFWVGVARDISTLGESIKLDDGIIKELGLKKF
ncbi:MAG: hypothetical protein CO002_02595 [Candidatus Portnoybacteria bacterium CG_4_8_14_3_um_filter_44_10]|uniref:Uncharacterized protein n=5 Tax=Candidatus Portnoyibacteriota TaxID=1817913 RepID=A0A2H0KRJ6_9BACT|nr:MAG: hypothetical protein AUK17_01365 [Parcubacteria group bacterium CG2_30_44_18]PIQ74769.1 MAG: hypothetical protein COV85_00340 [Candidatus Portnoybacteria bacterium CG11_big_fil_rev_8_21_14_0_20_44_10]PIS16256.1 MAG: hypothetical protein COT61_04860 [Candidatus Portnoybacteria bacterium CG09_land_8_20_14_0_10_44_13]PIW75332.1 MAG: hypothetical protein CO002_02595 [Candidatus Portnoybacteria bacterium CG_4_8_14_3_um_filter_44_10]PIZ69841.1 MAG: hypothetical protein COY11_03740 [Candidatus